jgi:hypothetical protein
MISVILTICTQAKMSRVIQQEHAYHTLQIREKIPTSFAKQFALCTCSVRTHTDPIIKITNK